MMKKNLLPLVAIALGVASLCTLVFYKLVAGQLETRASANQKGAVLVAKNVIARGSRVSAKDVEVVQRPAQPAPQGALRSVGEAEGLTALRDIAPNEPLTLGRSVASEAAAGIGVPKGLRAVSIQVADSAGVLDLLQPGHRVDVLAIYGEGPSAKATTILRDLEVLRVKAEAVPSPGKLPHPVATLLATPEQADQLALADAVARVRLLIRNPLDADSDATPAATVSKLLGRSPAAVPPSTTRQQSKAASAKSEPVAKLTPLGLKTTAEACEPAAASNK